MDRFAEVRRLFPYAGRQCYLNSAGVGLAWTGAGNAAAAFFDEAKMAGLDGRSAWTARTHDALARLAGLLNVRADRLQFVGSATEAMNLLSHSLKPVAGQEILILADDHPAVIQPWLAADQHRDRIRLSPAGDDMTRTDRILAGLHDRTAAVVVSHVDAATGERVDLARIAAACRAHDSLLIVDGSQATGCIDVDASLCDAYLGSTFKWLISGFGLGYVYCSSAIARRLTPVFRGAWNPSPSDMLRYGHINFGGIYVLAASLALLDATGWPTLFEYIGGLARQFACGAGDLGLTPLSPHTDAGIVAIACREPQDVGQKLRDRGISIQVHPSSIRISPHIYNNADDISRCLDALAAIRVPGSGL